MEYNIQHISIHARVPDMDFTVSPASCAMLAALILELLLNN
jgi:hypothetical protein